MDKVCAKCGERKIESCFYMDNRDSIHRRQSYCIKCSKASGYQQRNRERGKMAERRSIVMPNGLWAMMKKIGTGLGERPSKTITRLVETWLNKEFQDMGYEDVYDYLALENKERLKKREDRVEKRRLRSMAEKLARNLLEADDDHKDDEVSSEGLRRRSRLAAEVERKGVESSQKGAS